MPKNRHVFDLIYVFSSDPTQRPYYQPLLTDPTEAPYQKTLQKPDPTKLWIPLLYRNEFIIYNYLSMRLLHRYADECITQSIFTVKL